MTETPQTEEQQVRKLVELWAEAARSSDIEAIMACYAPDVVAFDAIAALQFRGTGPYRTHWETCLQYMQDGEFILEVHDLEVAVDGTVAFAHYLSRCGCKDEQGNEQAGWMRATVCCRKLDGGWHIAHEHYSVPFDPESGKALMELAP
jgi:uncharacterized protein (TIGR02246 family)